MKYVKVPFSLSYMRNFGGIETHLFSQMLSRFPSDSKIIGFGRDDRDLVEYVFIASDQFDDVPDGNIPPSITPTFKKMPNGIAFCESIDFNKTYKIICIHDWIEYVGVMDKYNYCKTCGIKQ